MCSTTIAKLFLQHLLIAGRTGDIEIAQDGKYWHSIISKNNLYLLWLVRPSVGANLAKAASCQPQDPEHELTHAQHTHPGEEADDSSLNCSNFVKKYFSNFMRNLTKVGQLVGECDPEAPGELADVARGDLHLDDGDAAHLADAVLDL